MSCFSSPYPSLCALCRCVYVFVEASRVTDVALSGFPVPLGSRSPKPVALPSPWLDGVWLLYAFLSMYTVVILAIDSVTRRATFASR
jgi:hypothetical protein